MIDYSVTETTEVEVVFNIPGVVRRGRRHPDAPVLTVGALADITDILLEEGVPPTARVTNSGGGRITVRYNK